MSFDPLAYEPVKLLDDEYIRLRTKFEAIEPEPGQFQDIQDGFASNVSKAECSFIQPILDALFKPIVKTLCAFYGYYRLDTVEFAQLEMSVPSLLRGSVILCRADIISALKASKRPDVYPTIWDKIVLETLRFLLMGVNDLLPRLLSSYQTISQLSGADFRIEVESEWREAMRFKDAYYGFLIHPRVGLVELVRYQQLPRTDKDTRWQISDYLAHLSQERPSVLETLTPLFKRKAFRDRIHLAYTPLIQKTIRTIITSTRAGTLGQTLGYEEEIRKHVNDAFDTFLIDFDYYYKRRPQNLPIPRWFGTLGGLPESVKQRIESTSPNLVDLAVDWDREIAFSHYMESKLVYLTRTLTGTELDEDRRYSSRTTQLHDNQISGLGEEDDDGNTEIARCKHRIIDRGAPNRKTESSYKSKHVIGLDGRTYLMVMQMSDFVRERSGVEVSADHLRYLAKTGRAPATRINDVFGTKLLTKDNFWLFEPSDENLKVIIDAVRDPETRGLTLRSTAARVLNRSEKTLSRYERNGLLTPQRIHNHIYYSVEDLRRLVEQLPLEEGRPKTVPD
jgi:hypothetical protein